MKTTFLTLVFLLSISSCSKDEEPYANEVCATITLYNDCDCVINGCDGPPDEVGWINSSEEYYRIRKILDESNNPCTFVNVKLANAIISGYVKELSDLSANNCLNFDFNWW